MSLYQMKSKLVYLISSRMGTSEQLLRKKESTSLFSIIIKVAVMWNSITKIVTAIFYG